jgi:protoporphyrinogen oxidase
VNLIILGGGLAGLSLAYFQQDHSTISKITIFEKENNLGGLCRSFSENGITYDIGPHMFFSKNAKTMRIIEELLGDNVRTLRRSNQIVHDKKFIQYPFENDLSKLNEKDLDYCVNTFINNPYEQYKPENMLQFFLATFGEGITNLYLRPYNEKIWKFDPAFMDMQMVGRIPKPPKEDILRSAEGETVDGYIHQLYFKYPKHGGAQTFIHRINERLNEKITIFTNSEVTKLDRVGNSYSVEAGGKTFFADRIVSTMPANILASIYEPADEDIRRTASALRYNSLAILLVNVKENLVGDHFTFMVADKNVIFHRLSRLDFLGADYCIPESCTFMVEITYKKDDLIDNATDSQIIDNVVNGLKSIAFIKAADDINFINIQRFEYAYVVYDKMHRANVNAILNYFSKQGIDLLGRFGAYEYLNMDNVIEQTKSFSNRFAC